MTPRKNTRDKILQAAAELARTEGAAHLSLAAVAAKAGLSKGGLLYNFPTKAALLKALVQDYIDKFDLSLSEKAANSQRRSLAAEYLLLAIEALETARPAPSGLLAVLSEDPELLAPVRQFHRDLLDRMKAGSTDETSVLILFLVLEGLRSQKLLGTEVLSQKEKALVIKKLGTIIGGI